MIAGTPFSKHPATRNARRILLWSAAAILFAIASIEAFQPDSLAALTAVPPWCWLIACVGLGGLGITSASRWERVAVATLILAFLLFSVEQSTSLCRAAWHSLFERREADASSLLRVVSVNCNLGSERAAAETKRFEPDLVFLQESPGEQAVQDLAETMFGNQASALWSTDCSILARGGLQAVGGNPRHFVQATWTPINGRPIEVICLRLSPPLVRYDLWAPSCWTEHADVRRKHRAEALAIASALSALPRERPMLIGGDCNAPAADGALDVWRPQFHDAFRAAGRGWGGTVLNFLPVLRFDQLWCSDHLAPIGVWSAKTQHSDHRMVVGDFRLRTN